MNVPLEARIADLKKPRMTHHQATSKMLAELGVVTVGDLAERWREVRRASLGGDSRYDKRLWRRAQGLLHDLGYELEETLKDTLRRG